MNTRLRGIGVKSVFGFHFPGAQAIIPSMNITAKIIFAWVLFFLLAGRNLSAEPWQFFVCGDTRSNVDIFEKNARSMYALDPSAAAYFNVGDVTDQGTVAEWNAHMQALANAAPDSSVPQDPLGIVRQSHFRAEVTDFGPWIRYLSALGNHDDGTTDWFANWNNYLSGQKQLGNNQDNGIYFSLSYQNAFFIFLDSVNPSTAQRDWLEQALQSPQATSATWKFAFFHHQIYSCNQSNPVQEGLAWVELFERFHLDIVFVGDSHTYERTKPLIGGGPAQGGVIYLNSSGGGAPIRSTDPTKTGTVSFGNRTDSYDCQTILANYKSLWYHFSHVTIDGCVLRFACYPHDYSEHQELPYDSFSINKCTGQEEEAQTEENTPDGDAGFDAADNPSEADGGDCCADQSPDESHDEGDSSLSGGCNCGTTSPVSLILGLFLLIGLVKKWRLKS